MTPRMTSPWIMLLVAAVAIPAALAQEQPGAKSKKTGKRKPREIVVVGTRSNSTAEGATGRTPSLKGRELYAWAEQAKRSRRYYPFMGDFLAYDGKSAPTYLPGQANVARLAAEARRLNEEILRAGPTMTRAQARDFEKRMRGLVGRMDRAARCKGKPGKEGPARCMCNCDKAYPGWGGGKGWNRFWCKTACIKLKVGKGGASVGG